MRNSMRNKYFAKYLPVQGEIKEGDIILSFLGSGGLLPTISKYDGVSHIGHEDRKLKLFLCSRDIQVGDKVFRGSREGYAKEIDGYEVYCVDDKELLNEEDHDFTIYLSDTRYGKVVGEISPEAMWVTEGMEFGEGETQGFYGKGGEVIQEGKYKGMRRAVSFNWPIENESSVKEELESMGLRLIYKIKCPTCKIFH